MNLFKCKMVNPVTNGVDVSVIDIGRINLAFHLNGKEARQLRKCRYMCVGAEEYYNRISGRGVYEGMYDFNVVHLEATRRTGIYAYHHITLYNSIPYIQHTTLTYYKEMLLLSNNNLEIITVLLLDYSLLFFIIITTTCYHPYLLLLLLLLDDEFIGHVIVRMRVVDTSWRVGGESALLLLHSLGVPGGRGVARAAQ